VSADQFKLLLATPDLHNLFYLANVGTFGKARFESEVASATATVAAALRNFQKLPAEVQEALVVEAAKKLVITAQRVPWEYNKVVAPEN